MKNRKRKNRFNTGGEPSRRFSDHETIFSWRRTLVGLAIVVVTSCATSRVERERLQLVQTPKIDALFQQLSTMDQEEASLLVPGDYEETTTHLAAAIAHAGQGKSFPAEPAVG